jgi:hypothetical protein
MNYQVLKKLLIFFLFSALSITVFRSVVINSSKTIAFIDLYLPNTSKGLINIVQRNFGTWAHVNGGQPYDGEPTTGLLYLILIPLAYLRVPTPVIFPLLMTLALCSMYYLIVSLTRDPIAGVTASILYVFSIYYATMLLGGFLSFLFSFALFPLYPAFLLKAYNYDKNSVNVYPLIISGVIISLILMSAIQYFLFACFLTFSWFLLTFIKAKSGTYSKKILVYFIILSISIFMNAYWIFPILYNLFHGFAPRYESQYFIVSDEVKFWSKFGLPAKMLLGFIHGEFSWRVLKEQAILPILLQTLLVLLASLNIILYKRIKIRKEIQILFWLTFVTGLLFSAGSNILVIGEIYDWLLKYFTFIYLALNRPYFFNFLSTFSIAVLIGIFISSKNTKFKKSIRYALSIFLICTVFISYASFFFSGDFKGLIQTVSFPNPYKEAIQWLETNVTPEDKVLILPPFYASFYKNISSALPITNPLVYEVSKHIVIYNLPPYNKYLFYSIFSIKSYKSNFYWRLLGLAGIKYIVIDTNSLPVFFSERFNATTIVEMLLKNNEFELVFNKGPIYIFKYNSAYSYVFSPKFVGLTDDDYFSLLYIHDLFPQDQLCLTSVRQTSVRELLRNIDYAIITNGRWNNFLLDLVAFNSYPNTDVALIKLFDIAPTVLDYKNNWVRSTILENPTNWMEEYWPDILFANLYDRFIFSISRNNDIKINVTFTINKEATYDVFIRLFVGSPTTDSEFNLQNNLLAEIDNNIYNLSFSHPKIPGNFIWIKLGTLKLYTGKHSITITNKAGFSAISEFMFIPENLFDEFTKEAESSLMNTPFMYIYDASRFQFSALDGINIQYLSEHMQIVQEYSSITHVDSSTVSGFSFTNRSFLSMEIYPNVFKNEKFVLILWMSINTNFTLSIKAEENVMHVNSRARSYNEPLVIENITLRKGSNAVSIRITGNNSSKINFSRLALIPANLYESIKSLGVRVNSLEIAQAEGSINVFTKDNITHLCILENFSPYWLIKGNNLRPFPTLTYFTCFNSKISGNISGQLTIEVPRYSIWFFGVRITILTIVLLLFILILNSFQNSQVYKYARYLYKCHKS